MNRREFIKTIALVGGLGSGIVATLEPDAKPKSVMSPQVTSGTFVADGGDVNIDIGFVPDYFRLLVGLPTCPESTYHQWIRTVDGDVFTPNKDVPVADRPDVVYIPAHLMAAGKKCHYVAWRGLDT